MVGINIKMMKEIIKDGIKILAEIVALVFYIGLIGWWVISPETFRAMPTNDLIMFSLLIIVALIPNK